ncbi:DUF1249 domain-containing protein [Alteromonas facilis]|uniref:DUF1249 domain-containing protein n=1 Tax=Alteromonas facilis TaxID=2048004 RepID=UPI001F0CCBE9|nr:DUF1249 domain-containing protein [Alteromonas facilis]
MKANKRKYVPHLPSILAVGEANYARMMRLLPDVDTESMEYTFNAGKDLYYTIQIIDSAPYTSTLSICQHNSQMPDYMQPSMQVRLYHDAKVAEVIQSQQISALAPSYPYPNTRMHQKNEKHQVNCFLAEWLVFCLNHHNEPSASA